ncbi:MAG: hypothetical protein M3326_16495, partial [Actinomycetota bacterium]|nr:hypothetical protein [Actinomycetota bacterium]
PDPGFKGTLPFGAHPPGDELEEGAPEAVPPRRGPGTVSSRIGSGRPLVPVAGGLVLLLLAMHMRLLNRRIKDVPEGDLPVEAPPARPTVTATPAPVPVPAEPPPRPAIYDILEEEDDWGPVDPDPDPDPDPMPEVEAELALAPEVDPDDEEEAAARWAPPDDADDADDADRFDDEVEEIEEIEVFEVVSPTRRRLARAASR